METQETTELSSSYRHTNRAIPLREIHKLAE